VSIATFKAMLGRYIVPIFSIDGAAATGGQKTKRFIWNLVAWTLVARLLVTIWAIVYPDSRGFVSIETLSIAPIIPGESFPGNDSYFYWMIAEYGVLHGGEWYLVNFSQAFPAVLAIVKPLFSAWSPFIVNTVFVMATPWFLVGFLNQVIKDDVMVRRVAIAIMFNPIFLAYSIHGLTEPMHYLLLFAVLRARYSSGMRWRLVEYACLVVLVLNRFIGVILAVFYLYKALFSKGIAFKQRVLLLIPVALMGGTYLGWELICRMAFGHSPSEARSVFWHHDFNFNPLSPGFLINQAPLLAAGAALGVLVLLSTFSRNDGAARVESELYPRIDMQALLSLAAATFLLLGLFNQPISVLRYMGTLFPLYLVMLIKIPSSRLLPIAAFAIATGMVASHVITTWILFSTNPPMPSFTLLDLVLSSTFSFAYIATSTCFYVKRGAIASGNMFLAFHLVLAFLIVPLSLYFP
jgi:hypothetical protein